MKYNYTYYEFFISEKQKKEFSEKIINIDGVDIKIGNLGGHPDPVGVDLLLVPIEDIEKLENKKNLLSSKIYSESRKKTMLEMLNYNKENGESYMNTEKFIKEIIIDNKFRKYKKVTIDNYDFQDSYPYIDSDYLSLLFELEYYYDKNKENI